MRLKNSNTDYGLIAKWLHWLTALLFLAAYISVYYRQWFTVEQTPANWTALQLHLSFGVSIGVLVILRIIWVIINIKPAPEPGSNIEHFLARIGHYALYAVMIILPITGYIGTSVDTEFFLLFNISKFESTQMYNLIVNDWLTMTFEEFEQPIDFIHKNIFGAWLTWILIAGHVLAALYHHKVKKDRTVIKMTMTNRR
ncbi:MAG: cytochrome b [Cognaticolwellia aestuarii]